MHSPTRVTPGAQAGHKLEELSVQQIVSCDNVDQGCNGGDTITAYQYVMQAGGLESQAEYPYTSGGGDNGVCKFNKKDIVANITGFKWATKNSDESTYHAATACSTWSRHRFYWLRRAVPRSPRPPTLQT